MRVLLVNNAYPTNGRFCAVWMERMADLIRDAGHQVDLLVIHGNRCSRFLRFVQYVHFYARLLLRKLDKYDCVYLHHPSHSYAPVSLRKLRDTKLVVHLHGADLLPPRSRRIQGRIARAFTFAACRRAHLVVVPSRFFADTLAGMVVPRRIHVYPSGGVDGSCFYPGPRSADAAGSPLRIIAVGQLQQGKGVDVLLRALARFRKPFKLTVVGNGREFRTLVELAEQLKIREAVEFVGAVPRDSVSEFLRGHDLFVFPTRLPESLGLVAVEAMACGIPVIGSRVGAVPEYVKDGVTGYLFEAGDSGELLGLLDRFHGLSDEEREVMGRNAQIVAERYDGEIRTIELLGEFRHVIGRAA